MTIKEEDDENHPIMQVIMVIWMVSILVWAISALFSLTHVKDFAGGVFTLTTIVIGIVVAARSS